MDLRTNHRLSNDTLIHYIHCLFEGSPNVVKKHQDNWLLARYISIEAESFYFFFNLLSMTLLSVVSILSYGYPNSVSFLAIRKWIYLRKFALNFVKHKFVRLYLLGTLPCIFLSSPVQTMKSVLTIYFEHVYHQ